MWSPTVCFQRAPLGVTVVLCYQIQRGWAVKCLLCRVFWAPLCRGIGAGVHEGIKGNQQIFNLIKILDYSGSPDTEKHEIQNILTPVSVKRSYLCSRRVTDLFFFCKCFLPVTWCYYACLVCQCQYVNTHRIAMEGRWRSFLIRTGPVCHCIQNEFIVDFSSPL